MQVLSIYAKTRHQKYPATVPLTAADRCLSRGVSPILIFSGRQAHQRQIFWCKTASSKEDAPLYTDKHAVLH